MIRSVLLLGPVLALVLVLAPELALTPGPGVGRPLELAPFEESP